MVKLIGLRAAAALMSTGVAAAAPVETALIILAEKDRAVVGGRSVQVVIPQMEIATSIDAGRVARAPTGGLIDTIIMSQIDDTRKIIEHGLHEKADATVAPLRRALRDFDIKALALTTTKAALAKPDWFQLREIAFTSDAARDATLVYRYGLSPDFTRLQVTATLSLVRNPSVVVFRQTIASIVQLRAPSYEPDINVARWSADNGKLAKASLTIAFAQFERLIPYALGLNDADLKNFTAKSREKAFAAGVYAPLIDTGKSNPGNKLLWSGGLVQVSATP